MSQRHVTNKAWNPIVVIQLVWTPTVDQGALVLKQLDYSRLFFVMSDKDGIHSFYFRRNFKPQGHFECLNFFLFDFMKYSVHFVPTRTQHGEAFLLPSTKHNQRKKCTLREVALKLFNAITASQDLSINNRFSRLKLGYTVPFTTPDRGKLY